MSQTKQSVKGTVRLDITEAQRTKLLALFRMAKQNETSGAHVRRQISAILTPSQQDALIDYLNGDAALDSRAGSQTRRPARTTV